MSPPGSVALVTRPKASFCVVAVALRPPVVHVAICGLANVAFRQ